jgi:actin-related protein
MTSATASAIRPGLRDNRQISGSPHTPSRFISSNFSSPGSLRQEEDSIIFQLTPRSLCAGFEGESGPQCVLTFGPDQSRRVGDYRTCLPGYERTHVKIADAAKSNELWRSDLSDVDLGLLEDKLERAVRECYNKYLLTEAGTARLVMVLPSVVPLPVISSVLMTLFERWRYPSITLLPAPTMCAVSAGVRSALVVDVDWEEVIVTPVADYREYTAARSTRAMKHLILAMSEKMQSLASKEGQDGASLRQDFDFVEDFVARVAFCSPSKDPLSTPKDIQGLSLNDSSTSTVDWPTHGSTHTVSIPASEISQVLGDCFFAQSSNTYNDDQETPLDELIFRSLLQLPPDLRGICMSRIIFTGPGSSIPGLKDRALAQVNALITKHGWTAIRGQHVKKPRHGLVEIAQGRTAPADAIHNVIIPVEGDFAEAKLMKQRNKEPQPGPQGVLRCIESLGAWAGASLVTSLKVKSVVDIERERFLSHGIAGATRDGEASVVPQRMSSHGLGAKGAEKTSFTLGGWG